VLKLIAPAQFTAILKELVMESSATNQAEWVRMMMRVNATGDRENDDSEVE
jgi:hypothetical protein